MSFNVVTQLLVVGWVLKNTLKPLWSNFGVHHLANQIFLSIYCFQGMQRFFLNASKFRLSYRLLATKSQSVWSNKYLQATSINSTRIWSLQEVFQSHFSSHNNYRIFTTHGGQNYVRQGVLSPNTHNTQTQTHTKHTHTYWLFIRISKKL